jgi:phosphatidylethanolamine-binding protein (PEBP) family uncharacterized protein
MKKTIAIFAIAFVGNVFAQEVSVDWTWLKSHYCDNNSPEFSVGNVPAGTKQLAFKMNDLDFQNKDHGGGTIEFTGTDGKMTVPVGALKQYEGPCPRAHYNSWGHDYLITVKALGSDGTELATGGKKQNFSAKTAK